MTSIPFTSSGQPVNIESGQESYSNSQPVHIETSNLFTSTPGYRSMLKWLH